MDSSTCISAHRRIHSNAPVCVLRIRSAALKMLAGNAGIVIFLQFQYLLPGTKVGTFDNILFYSQLYFNTEQIQIQASPTGDMSSTCGTSGGGSTSRGQGHNLHLSPTLTSSSARSPVTTPAPPRLWTLTVFWMGANIEATHRIPSD